MSSSDQNRSTAQIEEDLKRTRGALDDTLGAIERRLAPGQLMDDGLHFLRNNGATEYVVNLGSAAKRDPIPLALVGVGLAWLMVSGRGGRRQWSNAGDDGVRSRGRRDRFVGCRQRGLGLQQRDGQRQGSDCERQGDGNQRPRQGLADDASRVRHGADGSRPGALGRRFGAAGR